MKLLFQAALSTTYCMAMAFVFQVLNPELYIAFMGGALTLGTNILLLKLTE